MIPNETISAAASHLPDPLSCTASAYAEACSRAAMHGGRAGALDRYRMLYHGGNRQQLHLVTCVPLPTRVHTSESGEGDVRKFTLPLVLKPEDQRRTNNTSPLETESVIIPMIGRKGVRTHTLCVSSQIGCAMGCVFCQTAQMGWIRNLTPSEIVMQWWAARHHLGCDTIRNVVFMGMGEPMDNLDSVIAAIAVLTDHRGPNLPMSKVSISTVGRADGIARLAEQVRTPGWHRLNLAVSLNAPTDEIRSRIMPINRATPLEALRSAIEAWPIYGAAKICLEYVLIPDVNDDPTHAVLLGDFVLGRGRWAGRPALPGLVNVIPYNPRENSPWPAPEETRVDAFLAQLLETGVYAKRRRTKGRDTMAACGQLGNPSLRKRATVAMNVSVP